MEQGCIISNIRGYTHENRLSQRQGKTPGREFFLGTLLLASKIFNSVKSKLSNKINNNEGNKNHFPLHSWQHKILPPSTTNNLYTLIPTIKALHHIAN